MRYSQKPVIKKLMCAAVLLFTFLLYWYLTSNTPLMIDDFNYSYLNGERITSLAQVFAKQYADYFGWSGRVFAHVFAETFLMLDKAYFNLANAAVYTLLVWLVYAHCKTGREPQPLKLLAVFAALWYLIRRSGEATLWLTGSCNYLWGAAFAFALLLPYKKLITAEGETKPRANAANVLLSLAIIPLAFISGGYNENTSGAVVLFIILSLAIVIKRKKCLPAWSICGLASAAAGYAFLMLAPGNAYRMQVQGANKNGIISLVYNAGLATHNLNYLIIPLVIFILAATLFWKKNKTALTVPSIYFLCALAANYVMAIPGNYSLRAMIGVTVFIIIAALSALDSLDILEYKSTVLWVSAALALSCAVNIAYVARNTARCYALDCERVAEGREFAKTNPGEVYETYMIIALYDHVALYDCCDIGADETTDFNPIYSKYYDLPPIRTTRIQR